MSVPPGFGKFIRDFIGQLDAAPPGSPIPQIAMVVKCKGCGQKNRRVVGRANPRCEKCGLPL